MHRSPAATDIVIGSPKTITPTSAAETGSMQASMAALPLSTSASPFVYITNGSTVPISTRHTAKNGTDGESENVDITFAGDATKVR